MFKRYRFQYTISLVSYQQLPLLAYTSRKTFLGFPQLPSLHCLCLRLPFLSPFLPYLFGPSHSPHRGPALTQLQDIAREWRIVH